MPTPTPCSILTTTTISFLHQPPPRPPPFISSSSSSSSYSSSSQMNQSSTCSHINRLKMRNPAEKNVAPKCTPGLLSSTKRTESTKRGEVKAITYSSSGKQVLHRLLHPELHPVGRDGASAPSFGNKQMMIVPAHSSSPSPHPLTLDDVVPGSFYEIDPSGIPPNYPDQIRRIRIVMVSEKTELRVSLRFSSTYSLRCHFSRIAAPHTHSVGVGKNNLPPLDEKYVIGSEMACQLLLRRVLPEELTKRKMVMDFWVAQSTSTPVAKINNVNREGDVSGTCLLASKKGSCWLELWGTDMVSWGKRRRVRFLNRHEESGEGKPGQLLALTQGCEGKNDEEEESDDEEEMAKTDDKIEVKSVVRAKTKSTQKRKHYAGGKGANASTNKRLRGNLIRSRGKQVQVCAQSDRRKAKERGTINRWSTERYKLAEENMLKIMKERGAVFNNPITRPALRTEARKLVGDTGLLDHLLKHMSGKLAPGGEERFRRKHNADGAMEYWLESADLFDVRRQAGVDDPFWTPPYGWKLGDNPSQDPTCAREIRELRKEVSVLKREIDQLAMVLFERHGGELAGATTPSPRDSGLDSEQVVASIISLKEMCKELTRKDAAREEQLREMGPSLNKLKADMEELVVEMALSLNGMKEEMGKLKWAVESNKLGGPCELMPPPPMVMASNGAGGKKDCGTTTIDAAAAADETMLVMMRAQKAEKLQKLRSGFEICKSHASFQGPVQTAEADPLLSVPTPPSMMSSSSAAAASPLSQPSPPLQGQPQPGSPFKPIAGRHASTVLTSSSPTDEHSPVGINLNDDPITHF